MTSEYFFYHLFLSGVNQKYLSSSLTDFARNPLILLIHLLLSSITNIQYNQYVTYYPNPKSDRLLALLAVNIYVSTICNYMLI